ncbi:MAG: cytochrome c oxidase subunit 3 [Sphingobacteriales bacterium JAD_PAG50586_3]|nr:MAG: cytochrome c oxidase subunit 3 [Sphingobacteriales bacterium JAD_PAG50586_3]
MEGAALNNENSNIELMQRRRAKVTMMYIGIISIVMLFAGFTSGYILRMGMQGWEAIAPPPAFAISTVLIVLSSVTMFWAQYAVKKDQRQQVVIGLLLTLLLGLGFAYNQYVGFQQLYVDGNSFVSKNTASSWMNLLPFMHLLHLGGGLISLLVVLFKAQKGKYTAQNYLGLRLSAIYWHFLDILWVYLFVFLYLIH